MKKKYKMRPMAKLVITLDILVILMNTFLLFIEFSMLRLNLILAFGALALMVYQLEQAYIHIKWQNAVMGMFLEEKNAAENKQ
jgi:hypothetical protein